MDAELKNSILKTGTTILGIVCKDGIVMASDRQSTVGNTVMNKNSEKTVKIMDNFLYSGCGLASAIRRTKKILEAELRLKQLRSHLTPSLKEAASLLASMIYQNIRQPSMIVDQVGILFGGFNSDGSFGLYSIDPSGHIDEIEDYDASFGSGAPYVIGLLERQWKKNISVEEGIELAKESIKSSTQRDTASGYGIDVYTIKKDGIKKVVDQEIRPEYVEAKQ